MKITTCFIFFVFFVVIICFQTSCKLNDPDNFSIEDIFEFTAEKDSLIANGIDRVKLTVKLLKDTQDAQLVKFKTDGGIFSSISGSTVSENKTQEIEMKTAGKIAEVIMISNTKEMEATISAKINDFTRFINIPFTRYYPTRIVLSSNSYKLKPDGNNTANLTVILIPPDNLGVVTENTRLIFTAEEVNSHQSIPELYREALSNSSGTASVNIAGRTSGIIKMTCTVDDRKEISSSILIEFKE